MEIRTERLILRPLTDGDRDAVLSILLNAVVARTYLLPDYTGPDDPKAVRLFERLKELSKDESRCVRGIALAGGNRIIGFLNDVEISGTAIELGWALHPDYHNRGYCTEAVKAVIGDLFRRGFETVKAGAFEENPASLRVMQKCGMILQDRTDELEYRGKVHRIINYAITKTGSGS